MATSTTRSITAAPRTAVLASADISFRQRVRDALTGLRWQVREAAGGAEALAHLDASPAETVILDSWLPDLEIQEFIAEFEKLHPGVDLVTIDDSSAGRSAARSPRRNEVLFALRRGQDADGAAWNSAPVIERDTRPGLAVGNGKQSMPAELDGQTAMSSPADKRKDPAIEGRNNAVIAAACRLPEFIGEHPTMLEVSRRIRLVAPHATAVLIQGPTGTGKELVARALHRLSPRCSRPFVALNCAAIPESLLEAELFGHTRGAFTGAVQGRVGRVEAAHGGTLFLDEIGEMPLALQAKLLRFVESGELQRVGENDANNLQAVSTELTGIRDEVLSLANSSYLGQYIFSGSQGGTQPFTLNTATSPATVTYQGDSDVSHVQTPAGQNIQTNIPGDQIFTVAGGNVLGSLNNLIADFFSGAPSATSTADLAQLSQSLGYVDQQRAVIDNSINRLTASSNYASSESVQLLSAQDDLIQTDTASVATQLSSAETQQTALTQVIAAIEQQETLFQAL